MTVRQIVHQHDPAAAILNLRTMDEVISTSLARPRISMVLLALFAAAALILGAIGIYGVMSYAVGERSRELSIRVALGAARRDLLVSVLGSGLRLTAVGIAVGLGLAFAAARLLESLVFEVSTTDPAIFSATVAALVLVAVLATLVPALRAGRTDPSAALRSD